MPTGNIKSTMRKLQGRRAVPQLPYQSPPAFFSFIQRIWNGELSLNVMVGIGVIAIPISLHLILTQVLLALIDVHSPAAMVFFTIWITCVLIYAAVVCIGMWRISSSPSWAKKIRHAPRIIACCFLTLSLLYALYLFLSLTFMSSVQ